ncbi:Sec-independent protein translocase protein TatB [Novosphingobium naphthalenivorans]|uniref:Sec-independent protein translocase protein TatB n=1 Tax=Novosphingobium naphthalenivorans TaxID=273168 RepID=UPI00082BF21B|nr:Sec-independent protein translocase protein TatB [Novosphingobium naphthalenivorans]
MFDIGASELLMVVIVAVVVIGPKDMPLAMRTAGRWIGKMRKISGHFRAGIDAMVREAELEEMEKKWREQNEAIMKAAPQLPTAEEMQAPLAPAPAAEAADISSPDANTSATDTGSPDDTRQAELNLPPPPP